MTLTWWCLGSGSAPRCKSWNKLFASITWQNLSPLKCWTRLQWVVATRTCFSTPQVLRMHVMLCSYHSYPQAILVCNKRCPSNTRNYEDIMISHVHWCNDGFILHSNKWWNITGAVNGKPIGINPAKSKFGSIFYIPRKVPLYFKWWVRSVKLWLLHPFFPLHEIMRGNEGTQLLSSICLCDRWHTQSCGGFACLTVNTQFAAYAHYNVPIAIGH